MGEEEGNYWGLARERKGAFKNCCVRGERRRVASDTTDPTVCSSN